MAYFIKVLENKEFDKLPYKEVADAVGIADLNTNTAYIRKTDWGPLTKGMTLLTIQHELDHLIDRDFKEGKGGERNIRYKKWYEYIPGGKAIRKFLDPVIPESGGGRGGLWGTLLALGLAPFTGGASLGWMMPMATLGGGIGGGLQEGGIRGTLQGALRGFGYGALGSGITGGIQGLMAGPGQVPGGMLGGLEGATGMQQFMGGARGMLQTGLGRMGLGGLGEGLLYGGGGGGLQGMLGRGARGMLQLGGGRGLLGGAGGGAAGGGATADIMGITGLSNPMTWLGLGGLALGSLPTRTQIPPIGDIASKWLTQGAITKAGKLAETIGETEYLGEFQPSKEIQAFIEVQGKDIDVSYNRRLEQMDKNMMSINPQWKNSGERLEMIRRINEERTREKDLMQANWMQTAKQTHGTRQYNFVMNRLGVDEATKQDLLFADIAEVMWKYGIEREDLLNFRKIAADAGMYLLGKGLGIM